MSDQQAWAWSEEKKRSFARAVMLEPDSDDSDNEENPDHDPEKVAWLNEVREAVLKAHSNETSQVASATANVDTKINKSTSSS